MRERLDLCPIQVVEANTEHAQNRKSRQTVQTLHLHMHIIHVHVRTVNIFSKSKKFCSKNNFSRTNFFVQPLIASVKFSDPIKFQPRKVLVHVHVHVHVQEQ